MKTQITIPEAKDLPRMLEIESACFRQPWTLMDFFAAFRQRNVSGALLEEIDERSRGLLRFRPDRRVVVAFVVYQTKRSTIDVLNIAVDPEHRRRGHGTSLIGYLKRRLQNGRRERISALVCECNLAAQLFFRASDFVWQKTISRYWDDDEDAYLMEYRKMFVPHNRLLRFEGFANAADV